MARELTEEEVRKRFLDHIRSLVDYWVNEERRPDARDKLEGLAFSILVLLDGGSGNMPGFIVAPTPHEEDKQYCIDKNEDYYPENHESKVNCDIGGCLHEQFCQPKKVSP